jgi:hypothetical protein
MSQVTSVIVYELDGMGISIGPPEADAPLIVDPDTILTGTVALELLQPVAGRHLQVLQRLRSIDSYQLPQHGTLECRRVAPHALPAKEALRVPVGEALYHRRIITRRAINVNRYYVAS